MFDEKKKKVKIFAQTHIGSHKEFGYNIEVDKRRNGVAFSKSFVSFISLSVVLFWEQFWRLLQLFISDAFMCMNFWFLCSFSISYFLLLQIIVRYSCHRFVVVVNAATAAVFV